MLGDFDSNAMQQTDPVCGMIVDPQTAPGTSEYGGQTYYFCSPGCKRDFDRDPEKYVGPEGESPEPRLDMD